MRILIFTASAGNGHNSAAKRIAEKFNNEKPGCTIEIVDAYKNYATKMSNWIIEKGYYFACNYLINTYNYFFRKKEKLDPAKSDKSGANKQVYGIIPGMLKKIYDFKPDLIICTYFFTAVAMANIKRVYNIPAKVISMTLDYEISPFWQCAKRGLDYMFLTHEDMIEPFKKLGYTEQQLSVTGIPISDKFFEQKKKEDCREELKLDKNLFTLLIMKASFFPLFERTLIKQLKKINKPIQIVIVNGNSKKSQEKIDKLLKKANLIHTVYNIGYTNKIPEYLFACDIVFGKAGGLTTTETLAAGRPSLIINKLPQQEIYNCNYMVKNGCAIKVSKNNISDKINSLLNDKDLYNSLCENLKNYKRINAINKIYESLKDIPKANYKDLVINEKDKEIIKKINKQRIIDSKN